MKRSSFDRIINGVLGMVAVLFGVLTLLVGTRVLSGADPGYVVFRPLLIYNTMMGLAYVATGVLGWRRVAVGKKAAFGVLLLNSGVLAVIAYLYLTGGPVAAESVGAMTLRSVVWLVLFAGWSWLCRRKALAGTLR